MILENDAIVTDFLEKISSQRWVVMGHVARGIPQNP
jgi:hypothetical protein